MTDTINWNDPKAIRQQACGVFVAKCWAQGELMNVNHERLLATLALADGDQEARAALKKIAKRERRIRLDIANYEFAEQQLQLAVKFAVQFVEARERAAANSNSEAA